MTDAADLEALRLSDSALPVGTDSVSYGLEQFVAADRVADAADLRGLIETYLRRQLGPCDLVALRAAHRGARDEDIDAVVAADARFEAATLPAEFRESATRTGGRLLDLHRELREDPFLESYADAVASGDAVAHHPVVLGAVAARTGVDERWACLIACQEFATTLVGAAQRLLSLGHTDAQRILRDTQAAMTEAVNESADRSLAEMTPFAPLVDVLAADHETADRRLFVS